MFPNPDRKLRLNTEISMPLSAILWNLAFERKSSIDRQNNALSDGTDGWRLSDGGQTLSLPGNRVLWLWGDTFSNFVVKDTDPSKPPTNIAHFTFGSTVTVSGMSPLTAFGAPPIKFYARDPGTRKAIDITTGDGVRVLASYTAPPYGPAAGGWVVTGHENDPERTPSTFRLRWLLNAINIGTTLYMFYEEASCRAPTDAEFKPPHLPNGCSFDNLAPGYVKTFLHTIENTQDDVLNWSEPGSTEIVGVSGTAPDVKWQAFYDDTAGAAPESGGKSYIYIFGINRNPLPNQPASGNNGNLYVARVSPDQFADFRSWQFLHASLPSVSPKDGKWVIGDDAIGKLVPLAQNVTQEFSIDRLTVNQAPLGPHVVGDTIPVSRWLIAQAYWPYGPCFAVLPDGTWTTIDRNCPTNNGVLRISSSDSFRTFSNDDSDFYWLEVVDLEPEYAAVGGLFRGFHAHPMLSQLPQLLVGYNIFEQGQDSTIDCFGTPGCVPYGNAFCGDHGGPCGARRFAVVDLSKIWPQERRRLPPPDLPVVFRPPPVAAPPWTSIGGGNDGIAHFFPNPIFRGVRPDPPRPEPFIGNLSGIISRVQDLSASVGSLFNSRGAITSVASYVGRSRGAFAGAVDEKFTLPSAVGGSIALTFTGPKQENASNVADLQKLAKLSPQEQQQLVDYVNLQKLAKLSPEEQQQLVDYVNLQKIAKLSPQEQQQLVDYANLQKIAKLTSDQQRQLVEYAAAAAAKNSPTSTPIPSDSQKAVFGSDRASTLKLQINSTPPRPATLKGQLARPVLSPPATLPPVANPIPVARQQLPSASPGSCGPHSLIARHGLNLDDSLPQLASMGLRHGDLAKGMKGGAGRDSVDETNDLLLMGLAGHGLDPAHATLLDGGTLAKHGLGAPGAHATRSCCDGCS